MLLETATVDPTDAKIVRCLQLSPRVPFRVAAEVLQISEQTVARRYRRLERTGIVRVIALLRPTAVGQSNWIVRVRCKPNGADSLAHALAQRDDINWVTLASGGSEIVCVLRSRTSQAREELLMQRLPRTAPVLDISAAMVLHQFVGAGSAASVDNWAGLEGLLDEAQTQALIATVDVHPPRTEQRVELVPTDQALIDVLATDGRASYARLAEATGLTEARATRRVRALVEGGALYFDVDLSVAQFGLLSAASVWLSVTPAELDRAGQALAAAPEVAFAAAITGPQNLTASVVCRDVAHLYSFVTARVGAIAGVQSMEVTPVLRHVKQAGAMTDGHRLAPA
ncbi:Lrp/AsnC family transcriptional regulator [uncultured Jatrophihabitans sp.]|uniref:Lrp/AsnC family transcriptional regulator n=1 Tax=uncultured Jatrophihabitans sp. TaxID=1610747 RepID=UPI0035CC489D